MASPLHATAFGPGDRGPNFVLPDAEGRLLMFYERVRGNPFALLFLGDLPSGGEARRTLAGFAARQERFAVAGFDLFAVVVGESAVAGSAAAESGARFLIFADPKAKITGGYCAPAGFPASGPACFLFDANQRLLAAGAAAADSADWAFDRLAALSPPTPVQTVSGIAPVLMVPRVIDPALCQALIQRWEAHHEEGTVGSVISDNEIDRVYDAMKRRRDHRIEDPALHAELAQLIGRRIAPELDKAFLFREFRFDRFLVTCYDAGRGDYFRRHRDNLSPSTVDRRIALTLNLNTEDFTGGELCFPEYGPQRYRPQTGAAILFSCSLIHEALPVTEGRRFTLLSFLRDRPQGERPPTGG
ncbi:MAG TPA: 2OG-Fe(II) oxygenase [Alphaproteobacteria bacterium]|nr:2OG-Fe(II) oxygenase [Alphaproteobacteria bacterium]